MTPKKFDAMIELIIAGLKSGGATNVEIGDTVHSAYCRYRFATLGHDVVDNVVRYVESNHFMPPGAAFERFSSMVVKR